MNKDQGKRAVWKFPCVPADSFEVDMPEGAVILKFDVQNEVPYMWALINPDAPFRPHRFLLAGTGHIRTDLDPDLYLGTVQMAEGTLVLHLFFGEKQAMPTEPSDHEHVYFIGTDSCAMCGAPYPKGDDGHVHTWDFDTMGRGYRECIECGVHWQTLEDVPERT